MTAMERNLGLSNSLISFVFAAAVEAPPMVVSRIFRTFDHAPATPLNHNTKIYTDAFKQSLI